MNEPYNAADPKQVKKRTDAEKRRNDQLDADLTKLLSMPEFRRYVWRHMHETCGLMQSSFSTNGTIQTANIAKQDVAKALWAEMEASDPKVIPKMMLEWREFIS